MYIDQWSAWFSLALVNIHHLYPSFWSMYTGLMSHILGNLVKPGKVPPKGTLWLCPCLLLAWFPLSDTFMAMSISYGTWMMQAPYMSYVSGGTDWSRQRLLRQFEEDKPASETTSSPWSWVDLSGNWDQYRCRWPTVLGSVTGGHSDVGLASVKLGWMSMTEVLLSTVFTLFLLYFLVTTCGNVAWYYSSML